MRIKLNDRELHELVFAVREQSGRIGMQPEILLTIMAYETGGTLDPWKKGPETQWGVHRGLIQMGEPQRKRYDYTEGSSISDKVRASADYLVDRGWRRGMNEVDAYSIVNAGAPGLGHRTDENNGGAPGTVAEKVASRDWRIYSERMSNLLDRIGPSAELSEFARETENQIAYEGLRTNKTDIQPSSKIPEMFDRLEEIPFELSARTDHRTGRQVPAKKPDRSGLRDGMFTGESIAHIQAPFVAPDPQAIENILEPRPFSRSDVPVPPSKPKRDEALLKNNPFSLERPQLKQQAEILERNPLRARQLIKAAGRDPGLFGL